MPKGIYKRVKRSAASINDVKMSGKAGKLRRKYTKRKLVVSENTYTTVYLKNKLDDVSMRLTRAQAEVNLLESQHNLLTDLVSELQK